MRTIVMKATPKNFLAGIIITIIIFSLISCSTKAVFLTSSVVPAATGQVKVKHDKNNNYNIQIRISNLAGVERLQPPKKTYVVWMVTDQEVTKNIGRVATTNKLKVSFETVSSFKPVKIFLTAEENESAQYPDEQVVLTTDNFWSKQDADK
jgi:hypothetical protein